MNEPIYSYVIPVANVHVATTIPGHLVAAFVEGNWGTLVKVLTKRPYRHEGVWTVWPAALIKKIAESGPLSPDQAERIGGPVGRGPPGSLTLWPGPVAGVVRRPRRRPATRVRARSPLTSAPVAKR